LIPVSEETISAMEACNDSADAESAASIDAQQKPTEPAQLSATERDILAMAARDLRIIEGKEPRERSPAEKVVTRLPPFPTLSRTRPNDGAR
jgi:hypothetical protein